MSVHVGPVHIETLTHENVEAGLGMIFPDWPNTVDFEGLTSGMLEDATRLLRLSAWLETNPGRAGSLMALGFEANQRFLEARA